MKQSLSERINNIDNSYQQVKSAVGNKLSSKAYTIIDKKYSPEAFGSRYATWSNNLEAIRLIWDGKDDWFYLQKAQTPPFDWTANWEEIINVPYLREHDLEYASAIPRNVATCLH